MIIAFWFTLATKLIMDHVVASDDQHTEQVRGTGKYHDGDNNGVDNKTSHYRSRTTNPRIPAVTFSPSEYIPWSHHDKQQEVNSAANWKNRICTSSEAISEFQAKQWEAARKELAIYSDDFPRAKQFKVKGEGADTVRGMGAMGKLAFYEQPYYVLAFPPAIDEYGFFKNLAANQRKRNLPGAAIVPANYKMKDGLFLSSITTTVNVTTASSRAAATNSTTGTLLHPSSSSFISNTNSSMNNLPPEPLPQEDYIKINGERPKQRQQIPQDGIYSGTEQKREMGNLRSPHHHHQRMLLPISESNSNNRSDSGGIVGDVANISYNANRSFNHRKEKTNDSHHQSPRPAGNSRGIHTLVYYSIYKSGNTYIRSFLEGR
jgi:hypothetical protein